MSNAYEEALRGLLPWAAGPGSREAVQRAEALLRAAKGITVESMLVASTGHITAAERDLFEDDTRHQAEDIVVYSNEYGFFLYLNWPSGDPPVFEQEGWSEGLQALARRAREAGCSWLKLDRDGNKVDGVPYYDW